MLYAKTNISPISIDSSTNFLRCKRKNSDKNSWNNVKIIGLL